MGEGLGVVLGGEDWGRGWGRGWEVVLSCYLSWPCAALDSSGHLTDPLGLQMTEFPLNPMFAKMLLESGVCHMTVTSYHGNGNMSSHMITSTFRKAGLL